MRSIKPSTRQFIVSILCVFLGSGGLVALPSLARADAAICSPTLYWINGTGNWGDSSHWSASSGGPPEAGCTPDNVNSNVTFDSNSGSGTATVDYNATLGNVTFTSTTNMKVLFTNGTWTFGIAGIPPESGFDLSIIANAFYVVIFLMACALLVIGIWKFHQWRS